MAGSKVEGQRSKGRGGGNRWTVDGIQGEFNASPFAEASEDRKTGKKRRARRGGRRRSAGLKSKVEGRTSDGPESKVGGA